MIYELKVPSPGESITEVEIGKWLVEDGTNVEKDQEIAEIESDKATLTLVAPETGKISIKVQEGGTLAVGALACTIDTDKAGADASSKQKPDEEKPATKTSPGEPRKETLPDGAQKKISAEEPREKEEPRKHEEEPRPRVKVTSVAGKMMEDNDLSVDDILNGLRRITKKEVETVLSSRGQKRETYSSQSLPGVHPREEPRQKMSMLRRKLSQRLVAVKNETAMLTTFNEVDMTRIIEIRKQYQGKFLEKHGFKLGFMSFFTKAAATAMEFHPIINSMIDGDEIVTHDYVDVGVAVQTDKGLMVPVVRDAETKTISSIELEINELAAKARSKKISVEELSGGTFTITNGGVFGSLLSTPILNPPQSAILGMHNIVDRPMAIDGKVVIRPMMYLALSYDHRLIDGKDAVSYLVKVKELIEHPELLLTGGRSPESILLNL